MVPSEEHVQGGMFICQYYSIGNLTSCQKLNTSFNSGTIRGTENYQIFSLASPVHLFHVDQGLL